MAAMSDGKTPPVTALELARIVSGDTVKRLTPCPPLPPHDKQITKEEDEASHGRNHGEEIEVTKETSLSYLRSVPTSPRLLYTNKQDIPNHQHNHRNHNKHQHHQNQQHLGVTLHITLKSDHADGGEVLSDGNVESGRNIQMGFSSRSCLDIRAGSDTKNEKVRQFESRRCRSFAFPL